MNIDSLRSFVALVQYGSYTDAARALYLSQPTLSKRIAALEKEVGSPLFFDERPNVLTETGHLLMGYASSVIAQTDTFELQLQALGKHKAELIRIQDLLFLEALAEKSARAKEAVRKGYPNVTFETVKCKSSQTPLDALLSRTIDVGIQLHIADDPLAAAPEKLGYRAQALYGMSGELRIGVARSSSLAQEPNLRLRDFAGKRFMAMADRRYDSLFDDLRALCLAEGFMPQIDFVTTSSSRDFWVRDHGEGVVIIDALLDGRRLTPVDEHIRRAYKAVRPYGDDKTLYVTMSMITRDEDHGPAMQAFVDAVARDEMRRLEKIKGETPGERAAAAAR